MPTTDQTQVQGQLLYPLEDPEKAWNNALTDSGYNVYRANPFIQSLQRAGRGNRTAFLMTNSGQNPNQPANPAEYYGNYLKQQIQGGNAFENLNRAYADMPGAINRIRQHQNSVASGAEDANIANPYMALLEDELGSGNGQGTMDALSYLRSPLLGSQMGRSYTSMLGDILSSSQRTLAQDPATYAPNGQRDIWSYIFGRAGSPF